MSFFEDNHIHAVFTYASKVYGKKYFTQEVIVRATKNLTLEERKAFYAELTELKTCGMHNALFQKKGKARFLVFGKLVVNFHREKDSIIITSIVQAPKTITITEEHRRNFVLL